MEDVTIVIPGEMPGMNEIIAASKLHHNRYNDMKKINTEKVTWIAKSKIKKQFKKIDLEIRWICKNRRKDKDNIMAGAKFILDGLVQANVIENDGWNQIGDIVHKFEVDKDNPRVEVRIKEVEE